MLLASFGPYRPMPNAGKADVDARTPRLPLRPGPVEEPTGQELVSRPVHRHDSDQARLADQLAVPGGPRWEVKGHHPALGRLAKHNLAGARDIGEDLLC